MIIKHHMLIKDILRTVRLQFFFSKCELFYHKLTFHFCSPIPLKVSSQASLLYNNIRASVWELTPALFEQSIQCHVCWYIIYLLNAFYFSSHLFSTFVSIYFLYHSVNIDFVCSLLNILWRIFTTNYLICLKK